MKEKSFEEALKELEQIVLSMESGSLPLDDSIKKYEDGIKLARFCKSRLDKAEKKIEILIKKEDGSIEFGEFEDTVKTDNGSEDLSLKSKKVISEEEQKKETSEINSKDSSATSVDTNEEKDKKDKENKTENFEDMLF